MKLLLGIVIYLTYITLAKHNAEEFVRKMNEKRLEIARKFNVSNMHELHWNVDLSIAAYGTKCPLIPDRHKHYQWFYINSTDINDKTHNIWQIDKVAKLDGFQVLQPLQSLIGCRFQYQCMRNRVNRSGLCFVGPHNTPKLDHFRFGKIGSSCGTLINDNGLCTDNQTHDEEPFRKDNSAASQPISQALRSSSRVSDGIGFISTLIIFRSMITF